MPSSKRRSSPRLEASAAAILAERRPGLIIGAMYREPQGAGKARIRQLADESAEMRIALVRIFAETQIPSETHAWPALQELFGGDLPRFAATVSETQRAGRSE